MNQRLGFMNKPDAATSAGAYLASLLAGIWSSVSLDAIVAIFSIAGVVVTAGVNWYHRSQHLKLARELAERELSTKLTSPSDDNDE